MTDTSTHGARFGRMQMCLPEYCIAGYIAAVYLFSADAAHVWICTVAGAGVLAATALESIRSATLTINSVVVSRAAFALYCALTAIGGPPATLSVLTVAQLVLVMLAVVTVCSNVRSFRAVEFGSYAGTAALLLNAYFGSRAVQADDRYGNLLVNANAYAFALLIGVLFALRRILLAQAERLHPLGRLALIVFIFAAVEQIVVGSGSRKGMLCVLAVGLFGIRGTWLLRAKRQMFTILFSSLLVAGFVVLLSVGEHQLARFAALRDLAVVGSTAEQSAAVRGQMSHDAWGLFLSKPLFGWGFDQFRNLTSWGTYSHSNPLELLANGGLTGTTLYYLGYVFAGVALFLRRREASLPEDRLQLTWAAFTGLLLVFWGLASVQYTDKLDTAVLAAISTVPASLANRSSWMVSFAQTREGARSCAHLGATSASLVPNSAGYRRRVHDEHPDRIV